MRRAVCGRLSWLGGFGGLGDLGLLLGCDVVHDACDLHEFRLGELAQNRLKLGALDQTGQLEVVLRAVLHVGVCVPGVIDQVAAPD